MTVKLLEIKVEDKDAKKEIVDAFHAMFAMPTDVDGVAIYEGEEFVVHHCQNLIRSVLVQYKEKLRIDAEAALKAQEGEAAKAVFAPQGRELEAQEKKEAKENAVQELAEDTGEEATE